MVTHNVQLIKAAECELWVCQSSKKGSSFDKLNSIADYKKEVWGCFFVLGGGMISSGSSERMRFISSLSVV